MIPLPSEPRRLASLYRMVARFVSAGIPPIQIAAALRDGGQAAGSRAATEAFVEAFSTGGLPSVALSQRRAVPPSHVAVIAAGESMGRLDTVLDHLAASCEEQARVRAMTLRLLTEPAIAWLVIAFILPIDRLIRSGLASYLGAALPVLALPPAVYAVMKLAGAGRGALPGFTEPARLLATARFCRIFALLSGAGIALPRALREAGDAADHPSVTPGAHRTAQAVERGAVLGEALRKNAVLRPVEMALVIDGEVTGRLDVAFSRAAGLLEEEGLAAMRRRLRALGVVLFVVVATYAALRLAGAVGGVSADVADG